MFIFAYVFDVILVDAHEYFESVTLPLSSSRSSVLWHCRCNSHVHGPSVLDSDVSEIHPIP